MTVFYNILHCSRIVKKYDIRCPNLTRFPFIFFIGYDFPLCLYSQKKL